jgi:hypothetical protein
MVAVVDGSAGLSHWLTDCSGVREKRLMTVRLRGSNREILLRDCEQGSRSRRKPSLLPLTTCVLIVLPILYVLSYAPYLACRYEEPTPVSIGVFGPHFDLEDEYFSHNSHRFFQPVEWLIDHTPIVDPLDRWAAMWGVDHKMRLDSMLRYVDRNDPD